MAKTKVLRPEVKEAIIASRKSLEVKEGSVRLTLAEVITLESEIVGVNLNGKIEGGLINKELPFNLKFRLETKLINQLTKANELINKKKISLAEKHGAIKGEGEYKFPLNKKGEVIDKEGLFKYNAELIRFLYDEENSIDIEFNIKLDLFSNLSGSERYPILCKFIVE